MICRLLHLGDQALDVRYLGAICWEGNGLGAGTFVLEGVQGGAGGVAGGGFAGGNVDF